MNEVSSLYYVMQVAYALEIPVVARGAGTSLEGHTTMPYRGLCIDLSTMDAVVAVRAADMDATVQAGVRWQDFNAAAPPGLTFGVDPGPGATFGGMCGTGCSGTNAVRHGVMRANVISLTAVLADGTVIKTGGRARKSSAGYDLTSLLIGSEGTLAIVTEITIKLVNVPATTAVAVCAFPSVREASHAVAQVMKSGVQVGAVELLDSNMVSIVNKQSGFTYPIRPHVFFKFTGSDVKVDDDAKHVQTLASQHGGTAFQWTLDAAGKERLWEARKVALWSAGAMDPSRRISTTDVCVPLSRMSDLMDAMEKEAAASILQVSAVGHVGDGNVHHFILFDPDNTAEVKEAKRLNEFLVKTAIAMEGTCTGEHGVGVGKTKYLENEFTPATLDVMRAIKSTLDPKGILNPGKKLPVGHNQASSP
jgi:D-lactate dehydrogenase (cytochrome)